MAFFSIYLVFYMYRRQHVSFDAQNVKYLHKTIILNKYYRTKIYINERSLMNVLYKILYINELFSVIKQIIE